MFRKRAEPKFVPGFGVYPRAIGSWALPFVRLGGCQASENQEYRLLAAKMVPGNGSDQTAINKIVRIPLCGRTSGLR